MGDSLDLLRGELGALGFCQRDGSFVTTLDDLRALVEQSTPISPTPGRCAAGGGCYYRLRSVYRAAGALICLGRWFQRIPRDQASAGGG